MGRENTPVEFVHAIVSAYTERGLDPTAALLASDLGHVEFQPAGRVSADQFERLSHYAMRELDDEALGWFSRPLPWGSYGMLCRASLTSANLAVAISRWCRHHGLLTDDISLSVERRERMAVVTLGEATDLGGFRELCHVSLLRNLHGIACWLADTRITLTGVSFAFPAPAHAETYSHMFEGDILFGQPRTEMRFNPDYLDLPVLRDDTMLRQMLRKPLPLMVRQYRRDRLLGQQILRLREVNPNLGLDGVAEQLNLSARSLSRHLQREDTSFQALKDLFRRRRAERLLMSTGWSIKRIAHECGFDAQESFVRAFKGWTGKPPRTFSRSDRRSGNGPRKG